jgi:uncharacterized iron-regulated membrane protein
MIFLEMLAMIAWWQRAVLVAPSTNWLKQPKQNKGQLQIREEIIILKTGRLLLGAGAVETACTCVAASRVR